MKQKFFDAVTGNPVIAAVKDNAGLEKCLDADVNVVFILYGDVASIGDIVEKIKSAGKMAIVHMDLITGLSAREEAVDFIRKYTNADGIISTKIELVKHAKELELCTVYRVFVIDSRALDSMSYRGIESADFVEILPGIMPKIIHRIVKRIQVPVIAGGLISEKEDVIGALDAGATAISTTNQKVWEM